ncbi:RNA polymerase subunit sigma-70 [Microlunatus speluncae]|uniref:RNA polymerase subunit sigma-70 n=1 Tax=Microlunatus speluncae TaxID=2594267 RepID=UPI0012664961|nr:RNA polymerase subunit sigma-70 [Microlunatus speluncae]
METGMTAQPVPAQALDQEFDQLRGPLLAHCYRMTGSFQDAEDVVQETYLRARRGIDRFEERSSLKTWLYQIATNTCLSALGHRERRVLPSGLGAPATDPYAPIVSDTGVSWLQPLPDSAVGDPAEIVVTRESVRLALTVALQYLPPRQRAAFLLREVLSWSAEDIATTLGISAPAVKSLLQRARARLGTAAVAEPAPGEVEHDLLARYIAAFEQADVRALEEIIHADFTLESTTHRTWFKGIAVCLPFLARTMAPVGSARLIPAGFNGQPGYISYRDRGDGVFAAIGIGILTVDHDRVRALTNFKDDDLLRALRLPMILSGGAAS